MLRKLVVTSTSLRQAIHSFRGRSRDCQEVLAEVQKHTNPFLNHFTPPAHHSAQTLRKPTSHTLAGFAQAGSPTPPIPHPQGQSGLETGYILTEKQRMNENMTPAMHGACHL